MYKIIWLVRLHVREFVCACVCVCVCIYAVCVGKCMCTTIDIICTNFAVVSRYSLCVTDIKI